jgi:hypothetical protein
VCLLIAGDSTLTGSRLLLSVHGIVVCDNISNPVTAVAMLFGTYYVMNLHYPECAAITLEFIQSYFCFQLPIFLVFSVTGIWQ